MLIRLNKAKPKKSWNDERRKPSVVLGIVDPGASARGNSYWKEMRGCPREHALSKIVRLKREGDQEALTQGLIFHHALEHYYRAIQAWQHAMGTTAERPNIVNDEYLFGCLPEAERAAWQSVEAVRNEPGYEDTWAMTERMLTNYFETYRRQDRWRIIAVEETLEYRDGGGIIPMNDNKLSTERAKPPMEYSARLDLIVEDYDRGGMWVVEHKSAKAITEDLLEGYQLDQQIVGQVFLLQRCVDLTQYPPLKGVLINITSKHVKTQFQRPEVCPSRYHVAAFEESLRAWNDIRGAFEDNGWPKALGNCSGPAHYFKKCAYFDICHGKPELSVAQLMRTEPPIGFVREEEEEE
jgi:hypothetical protein